MIKSAVTFPTVTFTLLALSAFGTHQPASEAPLHYLQEERLFIEFSLATSQAALVVEGESEEALARVEVRSPYGGPPILRLIADGAQRLGALSGFKVETREASLTAIREAYPEGIYNIRARSENGQFVEGSAVLSHEMPPAAIVLYPLENGLDVPTTNLTLSWSADSQAASQPAGYVVVLEQGENDGLAVHLPPSQTSFEVPDGLLAPGTESHLEIAAVGPNGNRTVVEISFTTK